MTNNQYPNEAATMVQMQNPIVLTETANPRTEVCYCKSVHCSVSVLIGHLWHRNDSSLGSRILAAYSHLFEVEALRGID